MAILFVATEVDAQGQGDSPPATPKPRAVWKTRGEVFTLAFYPDGKTLAAGIGRIDKARVLGHKALGSPWGDFPGEIEVWDVANGKRVLLIEGDTPNGGLAFAPDGKHLIGCGGVYRKDETDFRNPKVGIIKVWDARNGKEMAEFAQSRIVTSLSFSPTAPLMATGCFDSKVTLWDMKSGTTAAVLKGHDKIVHTVVFSPDGKMLASGGYDEIIRLWNVATKELVAELNDPGPVGPGKSVDCLAFSPDGERLAAGTDQGVKIWDVPNRKRLRHIEGGWSTSLSFSANGQRLAWTDSEMQCVRWTDVATGKDEAKFAGHEKRIAGMAISPDGKTLATGSEDQTIRLWDLESWSLSLKDEGTSCQSSAVENPNFQSYFLQPQVMLRYCPPSVHSHPGSIHASFWRHRPCVDSLAWFSRLSP
ncbi:MAG: WD40 repeat domain-containing protein [Gemmataceae bacterium]|nr:WD40 repeat domain-containing protein [Gemmataceae bacterium]